MTRAKICGLTQQRDVQAAVAAGADAVGAIVDVSIKTPREVAAERAARLFDQLPPFVTGVLVTMGDDPETISGLADIVGADAIQVHGLPPGDVSYLSAAAAVPVLAAVDASSPEQARQFAPMADALVVDSVDSEGAGGTGRTHDWSQTATLTAELDVPVILAGGLTPENVGEAIETVEPYAVDVASGVEADPGQKDHDRVSTFLSATREARRSS